MTAEQHALLRPVGIGLQLRYTDGGADWPDEYYWMAWAPSPHGGERTGRYVGSWADLVEFADFCEIKL